MARIRRDNQEIATQGSDPRVGVSTPQQPVARVGMTQTPMMRTPETGLGILSRALDNFFGRTTQAAATLMQAEVVDKRVEVEQATEDRAFQGQADAAAGKPMDPGQEQFRSYYQNYSKVHGDNLGRQMASEFQAIAARLPPGADINEARDNFLTERRETLPQDNPIASAAALSRFGNSFDQMRQQHTQNSVRSSIASGVAEWERDIQERNARGDVIDFAASVSSYTALNPTDAHNAPIRVAAAVMASAGHTPDSLRRAQAQLEQPGTGVNGKSFAESFPEAWAAHQRQATERLNGIQTTEALTAWGDLRQSITTATTQEQFTDITAKIRENWNRFGGASAYNQAKADLTRTMANYARDVARANAGNEMMGRALAAGRAGDPAIDYGKLRSDVMQPWFAQRGLDPLNPIAPAAGTDGQPSPHSGMDIATNVIATVGVMDDETKGRANRAMVDSTNPAMQENAVRFYRRLEAQRGGAFVEAFLDPTAKAFYNALRDRTYAGSDNLQSVIVGMNDAARRRGDANPVTWRSLTGESTDADAQKKADTAIDSALKGTVGDGSGILDAATPYVPPVVRERIRAAALADLDAQAGYGPPDWRRSIERTVTGMQGRLVLLPGADGSRVVGFSEAPVPGVALGRQVMNPATGRPEDTTARAAEALRRVPLMLRDRIDGPRDLALSLHPQLTPNTGVYPVVQNGALIEMRAGQQISLAAPAQAPVSPLGMVPDYGTASTVRAPAPTVTLTGDREKDQAALADAFKDSGFTLIAMRTIGGSTVYALGYKPNFAPATPRPTAVQREQQFTPDPARAVLERNSRETQQRMDEDPLHRGFRNP